MPKQESSVSIVGKQLMVMVGIAVALGVAVALMVVPFAGVLGIGAKDASNAMNKLPASFDTGTLEQTTRILDADGNLITNLYDQNRVYVPLSQISRKMTSAIVSIEDYRFYQHGALDLKGTLRALITNQADNGTVQGGSSITQQLVKQTLLSQAKTRAQIRAATADTYTRKLKELRYAIALEQQHSKDWILEHYLNTAYFGDSAYGVQAAAKHYFDTDASKLTWPEAAMIAGMVKNPSGYNPVEFPDAAIARRNTVLERMAQLHVISDKQATKYENEPLGLHVQSQQNGCVNATVGGTSNASAAFYCDYVVHYLEQDPSLGKTVAARKRLLYSGGLTIKTSLKPANQAAADSAVSSHVYATDPAVGAIAEVQPGTGDVLALAQSRPMGNNSAQGQTYINYTIPQELGGSAGFQGGSTFKLFVLSTAIEDHIPTSTSFVSPAVKTVDQADYANCAGAPQWGGSWTVHNETGHGIPSFNMYTGMQMSINTYFIQLEQLTGICKPYALAKKMGVDLTDPNGAPVTHAGAERTPSFTLGIPSVSPLEMAGAYATVAARGKFCQTKPVTSIEDANGNVVKTYPDVCHQVMPKWTADAVNDILQGVQEPADTRNGGHTGFGYSYGLELKTASGQTIPSAGKTGTTNCDQAVWFDGYTPQIAASAMIAGLDDVGRPASLDNKYVGGVFTAYNASGSGFAGPVWGAALHPIENSLKPIPFHPIDQAAVNGPTVSVPYVSGMTVSEAEKLLSEAGFHYTVGPLVDSAASYGTVAYGSPSGSQPKGSVITLYISDGTPPVVHHAAPSKKKSAPKSSGHGNHGRSSSPGVGHGHGHGH